MKKIRCSVCGLRYSLKKLDFYTGTEVTPKGGLVEVLNTAFKGAETQPVKYLCVDCPNCGNIVRLSILSPTIKDEEVVDELKYMPVRNFVFRTEDEANRMLEYINQLLTYYDFVEVTDVVEYMGRKPCFEDTRWGWSKEAIEKNARIISIHYGNMADYCLDLPIPVSVHTIQRVLSEEGQNGTE